MARTEKLNFYNVAGGALAQDFDAALEEVFQSFDDPTLSGERVITMTIKFDKGDKYITTKAGLKTTMPTRKRSGIAWEEASGLHTQVEVYDNPNGQLDIERLAHERTTEN